MPCGDWPVSAVSRSAAEAVSEQYLCVPALLSQKTPRPLLPKGAGSGRGEDAPSGRVAATARVEAVPCAPGVLLARQHAWARHEAAPVGALPSVLSRVRVSARAPQWGAADALRGAHAPASAQQCEAAPRPLGRGAALGAPARSARRSFLHCLHPAGNAAKRPWALAARRVRADDGLASEHDPWNLPAPLPQPVASPAGHPDSWWRTNSAERPYSCRSYRRSPEHHCPHTG